MFLSIKQSLTTSILLLLLVVLFFSCKHYRVQGELVNKNQQPLVIPYFNEINYEYHYTAKIVAYNNSFNGVLVVKKTDNNTKRVVLISDFGNTLFDFEYKNGKGKAKYVMDNLNKKLIVNKLLLYFEFITRSEYVSSAQYQTEDNSVYVSSLRSKRVTIAQRDNSPYRLGLMSRWKPKAELTFYSTSESADSIRFISKELPIDMSFQKRTKQINADQ